MAHPDPAMDELHRKVTRLVEQAVSRKQDAAETFYTVREMARATRVMKAFGEPYPTSRLYVCARRA